MVTFEFHVEGGIKCGGCNWETSRLYVRANSREEATRLLHNTYGCSGCGELEWDHAQLLYFTGDDRENANPVYSKGTLNSCQDFSPNSDDALDGGGLCGDCYASLLAETPTGLQAFKPLLELLENIPNDPETYLAVQLFSPEWAAIKEAITVLLAGNPPGRKG